jgi:hypothetical protein
MPLDRAHITRASLIMLPSYVLFFGGVGLNFMTAPFDRLAATPMLRYADQIMSIRVWGCLFALCALLMAVAMLLHHRELYQFALLLCGISMVLWTLVAIVGIFERPISYSSWLWPAIIAAACFASNRSLVRDHRREV